MFIFPSSSLGGISDVLHFVLRPTFHFGKRSASDDGHGGFGRNAMGSGQDVVLAYDRSATRVHCPLFLPFDVRGVRIRSDPRFVTVQNSLHFVPGLGFVYIAR